MLNLSSDQGIVARVCFMSLPVKFSHGSQLDLIMQGGMVREIGVKFA